MTDDPSDAGATPPATPRSTERSELAARLRARADALRGPLESEQVAATMPDVVETEDVEVGDIDRPTKLRLFDDADVPPPPKDESRLQLFLEMEAGSAQTRPEPSTPVEATLAPPTPEAPPPLPEAPVDEPHHEPDPDVVVDGSVEFDPPPPEDELEPGTFLDEGHVDDLELSESFGIGDSEVRYPSASRTIIVTLVLLVVAVALVGGVGWLLFAGGSDDDEVSPPTSATTMPRDEQVAEGLVDDTVPATEPPPAAEELRDLALVDSGVTVVDARFEGGGREGTYAVVVENPNAAKTAKNVAVTVSLLDAAGDEIDATELYVEAILPGQRVAVASLLFDVPTTQVDSATATFDVATWVDAEAEDDGTFTFDDVDTQPEVFGGFATTFTVTSTFDRPLEDVGVTVVYRDADGTILGGANDFIERIDPDIPATGQVKFFVNIDPDEVATTELYATVGFGFFG